MYKLYIIILTISIASCSTQTVLIKADPNVNYKKSDVALVKPVAFIVIRSIDNNNVNLPLMKGFTPYEYVIEFNPGQHEVKASYNTGTTKSIGMIKLNFRVEKGRKYIIAPRVLGDGIWESKKWELEFKDVSNNMNCWTHSVGTWGGPSLSEC